MKNTVILKSYKDGIAIYLDDTLEFEQLCLDLAQKFRDSARFFGDMQVAVSFEGRTLTQEEENILVGHDHLIQPSAGALCHRKRCRAPEPVFQRSGSGAVLCAKICERGRWTVLPRQLKRRADS